MIDNPIVARIGGTAALVAVIAAVWVGIQWRFSPAAGSYVVSATVPESGIGLANGSDVKVRGVRIGEVVAVELDEDSQVEVHMRINPGQRVPTEDLTLQITPKTFFGEKQVELLYPREAFGQPPFLEEGDTVAVGRQVVEVSDVLGELHPVFEAIDPQDLATLFEAQAALEGQGDRIARSLEVSAEAARFFDEITPEVIERAETLTSVANQLTPAADAFDRFNANLPAAVALLSERSEQIQTNLDALSSFALTTAAWLDVEADRFDELFATGDIVGAFLERNVESLPSIIEGIKEFARVQAAPSPFVDDGGIYAPFKVFIDLEETLAPVLEAITGQPASARTGSSFGEVD